MPGRPLFGRGCVAIFGNGRVGRGRCVGWAAGLLCCFGLGPTTMNLHPGASARSYIVSLALLRARSSELALIGRDRNWLLNMPLP